MKIVYDFEIEGLDVANGMETVKIAFAQMKDLVYQRIKILEAEIDLYEDGVIVLNILSTGKFVNYSPGLAFVNLPNDLVQKIKDSLTVQDFEYIYKKIFHLFEP